MYLINTKKQLYLHHIDVVKGDFERVFFYFSASLFYLLFILLT